MELRFHQEKSAKMNDGLVIGHPGEMAIMIDEEEVVIPDVMMIDAVEVDIPDVMMIDVVEVDILDVRMIMNDAGH